MSVRWSIYFANLFCLFHLSGSANLCSRLFVLFVLICFFKDFLEQMYFMIYLTEFHNFSPNGRYLFIDDRSGPLFPIPQKTLPWQPILGTIVTVTFIWQACILKRLGIWQFQLKNIQCQYSGNILCKWDEDQYSNPKDYEGNNCKFLDHTAKMGISHRISHKVLRRSSPSFPHW